MHESISHNLTSDKWNHALPSITHDWHHLQTNCSDSVHTCYSDYKRIQMPCCRPIFVRKCVFMYTNAICILVMWIWVATIICDLQHLYQVLTNMIMELLTTCALISLLPHPFFCVPLDSMHQKRCSALSGRTCTWMLVQASNAFDGIHQLKAGQHCECVTHITNACPRKFETNKSELTSMRGAPSGSSGIMSV